MKTKPNEGFPPGVAAAVAYCEAVASRQIAACRHVELACMRFLNDVRQAQAGNCQWAFRPEAAERAMNFAGLMPNIKGPEAGRPLRLMPWQRFVFASLFGFVDRETGERRFRQGIVFVPRGNGKTSIAAPLALYLSFLDGEGGAEGYAAAVTRDQARILFDTAREMVRRSPEIRKRYGVEALANSVWQEQSSSHFRPISSDAKGLDGLNVQVAVCDEIASHRTSEVYDVLLTAMGKRRSLCC
jgi:phage terminase large subunit-like protein